MDQHGEPVPGADVRLGALDKPWGPSSQYSRKTDSAGRFSIDGIVGCDLSVEVSKSGYLVLPPADNKITSSGSFNYGLQRPHQPDADAPVVFTLHKQGQLEPLVKVGERNFRIARDGSPLAIELNEANGSAHQVVLRCWNSDLARAAGQRQYDWRLEVSVPGGGLLVRKDAFAFEAPEDGYVESNTIEMPASLPPNEWRGSAERSYFIRFNDGTFARANLRMRAGGDHFVVWESFLNPKLGSRNLESAPRPQASAR